MGSLPHNHGTVRVQPFLGPTRRGLCGDKVPSPRAAARRRSCTVLPPPLVAAARRRRSFAPDALGPGKEVLKPNLRWGDAGVWEADRQALGCKGEGPAARPDGDEAKDSLPLKFSTPFGFDTTCLYG